MVSVEVQHSRTSDLRGLPCFVGFHRDPSVRIPEEGEYVIVNDHFIGTPDPEKYMRGTNFLSDSELKQELEDGNIVPIKVSPGGWCVHVLCLCEKDTAG